MHSHKLEHGTFCDLQYVSLYNAYQTFQSLTASFQYMHWNVSVLQQCYPVVGHNKQHSVIAPTCNLRISANPMAIIIVQNKVI
jgi:hypothetical protein